MKTCATCIFSRNDEPDIGYCEHCEECKELSNWHPIGEPLPPAHSNTPLLVNAQINQHSYKVAEDSALFQEGGHEIIRSTTNNNND